MKIHHRRILPILILSGILAACSVSNSELNPNEQSSQTFENNVIPIPTVTTIITVNPDPEKNGLAEAPTESSISPIAVYPGFSGDWSPSASLLAGIAWQDEIGRLSVISPAESSVTSLFPDLSYIEPSTSPDVSWSPEGNWILFGGSEEGVASGDESQPWAIQVDGSGARQITQGLSLTWLNFEDWIDSETFVLTGYNGGGNSAMYTVNFDTGDVLLEVSYLSGWIDDAYTTGIPFDLYSCGSTIGVIPSSVKGRISDLLFDDQIQWIPVKETGCDSRNWGMRFVTWNPLSNRMLVVEEAFSSAEEAPPVISAQLLEWDLETNQVIQVAPKGVDAAYSKDGRWLAVVTLGNLDLLTDGTIYHGEDAMVDENQESVLNVIDTTSSRVVSSRPVQYEVNTSSSYLPIYTGQMAISPNSRYLSFLSLDEGEAIQILDLESQQVIASISDSEPSEMTWSPAGDRICYLSGDSKYKVLRISDMTGFSLSIPADQQVRRCAWSYNGDFISLETITNREGAYTDTYVFKIEE